MAAELEVSQGAAVTGDRSAPEAALAAIELEQALGPPGEEAVRIVLRHRNCAGEGFRRRVAPGVVELFGDSPRGLLFGAYALLDELGVRWPWPGEQPSAAATGRLERAEAAGAPQFPGRCMILGERALLEQAEEWIVWAGRNRLNTMFIHASTRRAPVGQAPEAMWRERRARLVVLARERGMVIEHGGHVLPELLPPDQIAALMRGQAPTADARRALERYVLDHPEADVLHLWIADLPEDVKGTPHTSDAAMRATNAVAAVVADVRPGVQVAHLAYHQTEEVPSTVRPLANVCLLYAPRERCYQHALNDPTCARNARYRKLLLGHVHHFASAEASPPRVLEYWFDAIRFCGAIPDLSETMAQDLAFYRDAGVHTVQMLMTGHGASPSMHPNPIAFTRLTWEDRVDDLRPTSPADAPTGGLISHERPS